MSSARDYVLGTHQAEIDRLGLQHQVWRPHMLDAWSRAGMTRGSKVIDFGAGPGYALLPLMTDIGFKVREVRPLLFAVHPSHFTWQWPAAFVATNAARLVELGRVSRQWSDAVERDFIALAANPDAILVTPLVMEIIAEK
jgi:hypothetical protein